MKQRLLNTMLTLISVLAGLCAPALAPAYALAAASSDWQAQYWANRYLSGSPAVTKAVQAVSFDWGFGAPDPTLPKDNWSARWTRTTTFQAGWYRFKTFTDDGVRLWVDGKPIIDQWFDMPGTSNTGDIYLTQGAHEVKMEYYERTGYARAYLSWSRFSGEPRYTGWMGEYYNNRNLSGDPVFVRDDAKIDFDWGWETMYPGVGLTDDNFSIRWTRQVQFEAGYWQFQAKVSDGMRVYVDNQKVIDAWQEQDLTTLSGDIYLAAGVHQVKVEYFEGRGRAVVQLNWVRTSAPVPTPQPPSYTHWKGEYYDNRWLTGAPPLVRNDTALDFNWGVGSPAGNIPADDFSVRWTRTLTFAAGTYRFYVRSDDGARLWVDSQLVSDHWNDQAATTFYGDATLAEGAHTVKLEYYEHTGFAEVKLWWEATTTQPSSWQADYFNNTALSGAPKGSETVAEINFNWGEGGPGHGAGTDRFSVRYRGTATFAAGFYTFHVRSDDGIRLWVDEQLVLDRWVMRSVMQDDLILYLAQGIHPVRLEYFEEGGLAEVKLWWEKREGESGTAWTAQYFTNPWLIGQPAIVRSEASLDFNWGTGSPSPVIPVDNFSARWTRMLTLQTAQTLTFSVTCDDGFRLWVDNQLVLDKWYDQAATATHTALVPLAVGSHTITLEYYEHTGFASVKLSW